MNESLHRIAVLADNEAARARLQDAVGALGAVLVYSGSPGKSQEVVLRECQAQAWLVALEPAGEAALDVLDDVLSAHGAPVLFEDVDVLLQREGWDEARWLRHLGMKLGLRHGLLPEGAPEESVVPVAAPDATQATQAMPAPGPAMTPDEPRDPAADATVIGEADTPGSAHAASMPALASMPEEARDAAVDAATAGEDGGHWLDPAAAEFAGFAVDRDDGAEAAFAPSIQAPIDGIDTLIRPVESPSESQAQPWADAAHGIEAVAQIADPPASGAPDMGDSVADRVALPSFSGLSLEQPEADAAQGLRVPDTNPGANLDVEALVQRVAGMTLVPIDGEGASGADVAPVVVHAGIGGPDAVRRFLAALPEDFARPVLLVQQLGNGLHERLVQQMQRASPLMVVLAGAGRPLRPGQVHVLPPGLGLRLAQGRVSFDADGGDPLDVLPAAGSTHVVLSGADPARCDLLLRQAGDGAVVLAQAADGCYDHRAAAALIAGGVPADAPEQLAARLAAAAGR